MTDGTGGPGTGGSGGGDAAGPGSNGSDAGDSTSAAADESPEDHGAYAHATPAQLLGEVKTVRRQARRARHGYWFPLVLFGLLTLASVPFYIQHMPTKSGVYEIHMSGPKFFQSSYLGGFGGPLTSGRTPYYWLAAMVVGLAATAVWYRQRGMRIGLRTPTRGYVITGVVLLILALLIPVLAEHDPHTRLWWLMPGDLLIRGTFPFVLIALGLCVLAWVERSIALTVIAVGYLALSLVASLYDIENVFYKVGWNISPGNSGLPNVVLPALVLLLSGAGAWVVQRRRGPRPGGPAIAGPAAGGAAATGRAS